MYTSQITWSHTFVLVAGVLGYLLISHLQSRRRSDVHRLIKPKHAHWLWGHEKLLWESVNSRYQSQIMKDHGHVVALKGALLHPDILLVSDPAALHHVYATRCYHYMKSKITRPTLERVVGRSLLWAEGDQHKKQRQMLSSIFTHDQVRTSEEEIYAATNRMIDKLRDHIGATSTGDANINMHEWLGRATMDIIGIFGFGHDFQCGESSESQKIKEIWSNLISAGMELPGFVAPLIIRIFPWLMKLPVKAMETQGTIRQIIRGVALQIVQNREAAQEKPGKDLLSVLLRMKDKNMDLDNLLDQATTFMLGGHETTSNTLAFACLELARNPQVQNRLRRELQDFGGSEPGSEPTYNELRTKLPYLDAVCKETLRMWPIITHAERMALEDDELPLRFPVQTSDGQLLDSIRIRKGQILQISVMAINRDPTVWGEDSEKFVPERWLEPGRLPPSDKTTSGFAGIFSFNEGPRMCIGYRLALFEVKLILATLVKQFKFTETDAKVESRVSITLQPYVAGQRAAGPQLPLRVQPIDA